MTMSHTPTSEGQEARAIRRDGKALLALHEEHVQAHAVLLGWRPAARVPYHQGHPTGNYHLPPDAKGACKRLASWSYTRTITEYDAAKLLDRCGYCMWN